MDNQRTPISKIVFIGVIVTVVLFILWKWLSPSSTVKTQPKTQKQLEEKQEEEEVDSQPPTKSNEYESFMDRLQKGEQEARRRALATFENEKKARAAEEESQKAKDLERVKKHTLPVGSTN
jgi:lipopolysaccharide export LptBFGC system permease protein LptF